MNPDAVILDFHSFLSDDTTQLASTVFCHMDKLIKQLMASGVLAKGGRVLSFTDGCAKQYKCANAIFFMSLLASTYGIVVDRGISCAGHGKSLVDAINGVDKNTIQRRTRRTVVSAHDALKEESSSLKVHSFNNSSSGDDYSAAEDCKRILEQDGGHGVKSEGPKRAKRESKRGINCRYWHTRKLTEKLNASKCATIQIPEEGVSFKDMYHYYTCKELGVRRAALKRVPYCCPAYDSMIRLSWRPGVPTKVPTGAPIQIQTCVGGC